VGSGSSGYVGVCPSIYGFWLHLCLITPLALLNMLVSVLRYTDSDYTCVWLPLWFVWLCWCLFFDLRILITLVSDYPTGSFDYVGVCPSIYGFWLHLCLIIPLVRFTFCRKHVCNIYLEKVTVNKALRLGLLCLRLSVIHILGREPEYPKKATDLPHVTGKLNHLKLYLVHSP
jgi:hypothetical protein